MKNREKIPYTMPGDEIILAKVQEKLPKLEQAEKVLSRMKTLHHHIQHSGYNINTLNFMEFEYCFLSNYFDIE